MSLDVDDLQMAAKRKSLLSWMNQILWERFNMKGFGWIEDGGRFRNSSQQQTQKVVVNSEAKQRQDCGSYWDEQQPASGQCNRRTNIFERKIRGCLQQLWMCCWCSMPWSNWRFDIVHELIKTWYCLSSRNTCTFLWTSMMKTFSYCETSPLLCKQNINNGYLL